jgi:uncharacterized protein YndB with AHSA1/START domain
MIVQKSIEIASPPDKIWSFLIEPEKIMKWCYPIKNFKYTGEQRSGVGTPFYYEEKSVQLMKLNFKITEWVEKQKLAYKMTSGNFVKGDEIKWAIEATPSGSKFTYFEEVTMPWGFLGKFIGLFAQSGLKAEVNKMLPILKSMAEAKA